MNSNSYKALKRLVRIKSVIELTGLSKSYIYELSKKGLFPKSIQLVPGGTSVAWVECEVKEWIDSRIQERNLEVGRHD
jgi:prophage regulatory protein